MKTIVGLFDDFSHAQKAMTALEGAGVPHNDMSLVANNEGERYASNTATTSTSSTAAPAISGGAIGHDAIVGAEIGGAAGLLIGLTGLAIPGLGWIATAGWLGGMLLGAGTGAATGAAIGLVGALTHAGVPDEDASYYNEGVRQGGTLLAVKSEDSLATRVAEILDENGAVNIDERADQYRQQGFMPTTQTPYTAQTTMATAASNNPTPRLDTGMNTGSTLGADLNRTVAAGETVALPIVEEELQVGKREVQRGGVRVYTHVTSTPVEESINLHEEHVTVDRRPVDRAVSPTDMAAFREGSMELRETAEEAVVSKQARVVEEVVIGKQATDRTETVRDTVRRTDVDVEQLDTNYNNTGVGAHTARDIENDAANVKNAAVGAAERVEGNIPGVQTGGRAMDGTPDTRGITEKIADTVTGNRVDDKTGKPV